MVKNRKKTWKNWYEKVDVKRRRQYKKKAMEKASLLEKHSSDYAPGLGLDIGYGVGRAGPKKKEEGNPTQVWF